MIKTDKGLVQIKGLSVEIMADFRVICRALRKTFVEEFGEDQGKEIFDALLVDDSDESSLRISKAILEHIEKKPDEEKSDEKEPTTGNPLLDAILTAVFGGGAK